MAFENVMKYRDQIYRCNTCCRCPRGPWDPNQPETIKTPEKQCPTYETHKSVNYASQGTMLIIRELLEEKIQPTEELAAAVYECLLCKGCDAVCAGREMLPLGQIECATIFRALRADLVDLGVAPPPAVKKVADAIAAKHNRQGTDKDRKAWADGLDTSATADTVVFAGCTAAYQDSGSLLGLASVLRAADVKFGVLDDEWCCGALQIDSGVIDGFKASAQHNIDAIRETGAKEVVVTCADCYRTLKRDYPKYFGELGFDVIHSSELILRLLEEGKVKFEKEVDFGGKATYFDPCFLARGDVLAKEWSGVIEQPRSVLNAIPGETEWEEMDGFGRYTYCCGRPVVASGSVKTYQNTGQDRVKDALAIDAKTIVTGCANCKVSLTSAAKKLGAEIKVMDITEATAAAVS